MEFHVVIPVRYESECFPGKALVDINGKPMLQHVYERAVASGAEEVVIATDDKRVIAAAEAFGAAVCVTSGEHHSGAERLSEAVGILGLEDDEIVVCVQDDEPCIPSKLIREVASDLNTHDNVKVVSICESIENPNVLFNPNTVKVVLNRRHYATYFSHAPIPWERDAFEDQSTVQLSGHHYRHIPLYAYRVGFLQEYMAWDPCPAEELESLEQLRILWHGGRIHMLVAKEPLPPGIRVPEDVACVEAYLKKAK